MAEVTDDNSLPKKELKGRQGDQAAGKSNAAKRIKHADKAYNLVASAELPPHGWSTGRKPHYLAWARAVAANLRGVASVLEAAFAAAAMRVELSLSG